MARAYGLDAIVWLGEAKSRADLGRDFGCGLSEAEVRHLRDTEWARTAEDVLWRRTKLGLHMDEGQQAAMQGLYGRDRAGEGLIDRPVAPLHPVRGVSGIGAGSPAMRAIAISSPRSSAAFQRAAAAGAAPARKRARRGPAWQRAGVDPVVPRRGTLPHLAPDRAIDVGRASTAQRLRKGRRAAPSRAAASCASARSTSRRTMATSSSR
jgi:hypothetical protein